jgi:hypothetical protein
MFNLLVVLNTRPDLIEPTRRIRRAYLKKGRMRRGRVLRMLAGRRNRVSFATVEGFDKNTAVPNLPEGADSRPTLIRLTLRPKAKSQRRDPAAVGG